MRLRILAAFVLLAAVVSACGSRSLPATATLAAIPTSTSTIEAQALAATATPAPTVTATPFARPTPLAGKGVVVGVLKLVEGGSAVPVVDVSLYLAEAIKDESGAWSAAALDRSASPKAWTDEQGVFVFADAPPGRYSLVLDAIVQTYLLHTPDKGETLFIDVEANATVDMGELVYQELPVPAHR